jgi:hypothetical protein
MIIAARDERTGALEDDGSELMEKRGHGPRALAALLPRVAEPAARKRGFSAVEIVTRWAEIVGPALAADSMPEQLTFPRGARAGGTLQVVASGAVSLEIQHLAPAIVERINTYFGYAAVARIALIQGQVRRAQPPAATPEPAPLDEARRREIESSTAGIEQDGLRRALRRLGHAVGAAGIGAK